jgi:cytochrome c biogenesis protein CcmG, thiol:disulfide interchange protein DsbE
MRRRLVPLAVVAVLAGAFVAVEALSGTSDTTSARTAPALPRRVLVGPRVDLAQLRGKPAVVHFWASWCGPCTKEAPDIARLPSALRGRARVVGVDWSDSHGGAMRFARDHGWTFPILEDDAGRTGAAWHIQGLPTTFVLDANGRIVKKLTGPQTVEGLESALSRSRT